MTRVLAYDSSWAVDAGIPVWAMVAFGLFIVAILVGFVIADLRGK